MYEEYIDKERRLIETNTIVVFNSNVTASKLEELIKDFCGTVVVNGNLTLTKNLKIKGSLYVKGSVTEVDDENIEIEGDFYCYGSISCYKLKVHGFLYGKDDISSTGIAVGENLYCESCVDANDNEIDVFGNFESDSVQFSELTVLGTIRVNNTISIE